MTATQPVSPVCPECGGTNTMILSDGQARCFDDQHEWDPAAVTALARPQRAAEPPHGDPDVLEPPLPETPALEPFGMASVDDVLGPPPEAARTGSAITGEQILSELRSDEETRLNDAQPILDELVGGTARLEGGQVATVLSFPDYDNVVLRMNDGRDETVALSDVEHITPRAPAYQVDPAPAADPTFEAAMALSGRMVTALSAIIDEVGEGPVVDGAVTLTLSRMIIGYEVEIDDLMGGIEQIASVLAEGDQPTEET